MARSTATYKIYHRDAEVVEGGWGEVAEVRVLACVRDELQSWPGPSLHHGDLVRVVGARQDILHVFDGSVGVLMRCPSKVGVASWEGSAADAVRMIRSCGRVDARRVVMAACACARTVAGHVPSSESRPLGAIESAERWCRGAESADSVVRAAFDASAYAADVTQEDGTFRSMHRAASRRYAAYAAYYAAWGVAEWTRALLERAAAAATYAARSQAAALMVTGAEDREYWTNRWLNSMSPEVRRYVPLSVAACAIMGLRDPLPFRSDDAGRRGTR